MDRATTSPWVLAGGLRQPKVAVCAILALWEYGNQKDISDSIWLFLCASIERTADSKAGVAKDLQKGWNSINPDGNVPNDLLKDLLDKSYQLVLKGLSKKKQKEILGNEDQNGRKNRQSKIDRIR